MIEIRQAELRRCVADQPYPLLFVTISGAHLYGFPSPDSDYDLRGVHLLPLRAVVGLRPLPETIQQASDAGGVAVDLVTHDAAKFCRLLLRHNGYVLEQLYSPLVLHTTAEHEELKALARGCITRHHAHHYLGFARKQWQRFGLDQRVKTLLYVYRVLLTGIHLMRTGQIEASLPRLNAQFGLADIDELVARKRAGAEDAALPAADVTHHEREYERLTELLERAFEESTLPEAPSAAEALNDFLVRLRLADRGGQ